MEVKLKAAYHAISDVAIKRDQLQEQVANLKKRLVDLRSHFQDAQRHHASANQAIKKAVAAEQERCVGIANDMSNLGSNNVTSQQAREEMQIRIAAAIRLGLSEVRRPPAEKVR